MSPFLQVTTLSYIASGDGKVIEKWARQGSKSNVRPSPYKWPRQTNTAKEYWQLWRKALKVAFPHFGNELGTCFHLGKGTNGQRHCWE